jgi:hypothetical protein
MDLRVLLIYDHSILGSGSTASPNVPSEVLYTNTLFYGLVVFLKKVALNQKGVNKK